MTTRITIDRTVFGKLKTQLAKPEHAETKAMLEATKTSENPRKDTILWNPDVVLMEKLLAILQREMTFSRKKDSGSYQLMQSNERRIQKLIADSN